MTLTRFARAVALAALAAGAGCLTVGREFDAAAVPRLQVGVTTRADVQRLLGDPWRTGLEDGRATWTFGEYRYRLLGESDTRDLVVRFAPDGVISSYSFSSTLPEDRVLVPAPPPPQEP